MALQNKTPKNFEIFIATIKRKKLYEIKRKVLMFEKWLFWLNFGY